MLDNLKSSLRAAIKKIVSSSGVDEELIKELSKDVQRSLLQSDVNVRLVLEITKNIEDRSLNEKPPPGLSRKDHIVKILLKRAKQDFQIEGLVYGGMSSEFQKKCFEKICKENDLKIITPLWKINVKEYMNDLIVSNFKFILTSVSSDGLDERWLGKIISAHDILQLNKLSGKYGFNLNFEGGEAETFVIDCPLYSYPIIINKSKTTWDGYRGMFEIEAASLDSNAG